MINVQLKASFVGTLMNASIISTVNNGIMIGDQVGSGSVSGNALRLQGALSDVIGDRPNMGVRGTGARPQLASREVGERPAMPRGDRPQQMPSDAGAAVRPGRAPHQGAGDTDLAIREASGAAGVDVNTMRGVASIESDMNPGSNRNRRTQYKGLYQIGSEEWRRFGRGNIYNAHDNAMAAGRMFAQHKAEFRARFGRDPTDRELYMIHQQGLGFYTRGAMTNIGGNRYPGMRGGQTHQSFEAGWGRELERRARAFAAREAASRPQVPQAMRQTEESAP